MNTRSNAIPESPVAPQVLAPTVIPVTQRMYWSLQRELWENRSLYLAPLAVAALILVASLIGTNHLLPAKLHDQSLNPAQQQELIEQPYNFAALVIMGTTFVVAVFYCLDALHGERRDRSILFWKSLPVSDLTTVLSKAITPVVILPLVTFAITAPAHPPTVCATAYSAASRVEIVPNSRVVSAPESDAVGSSMMISRASIAWRSGRSGRKLVR